MRDTVLVAFYSKFADGKELFDYGLHILLLSNITAVSIFLVYLFICVWVVGLQKFIAGFIVK